jgi:hypothetical protein
MTAPRDPQKDLGEHLRALQNRMMTTMVLVITGSECQPLGQHLRIRLTHTKSSSRPTTIEQHLMDLNKKSKEFILDFKEQVAQGRAQAQATLSIFGQDLYAPSHQDPTLLPP